MSSFFFGMFFGGTIMLVIMCLLAVAKEADKQAEAYIEAMKGDERPCLTLVKRSEE